MEAPKPSDPAVETPWRAKLTPLQGAILETDIEVTHMASRVVRARCKRPLAPGLPVRIDQRDTILLGEIVACREDSPGEFSLLIEMNESLSGLHSLRQLVNALLGEARADEPVHPLDKYARPRAETPAPNRQDGSQAEERRRG